MLGVVGEVSFGGGFAGCWLAFLSDLGGSADWKSEDEVENK